MMRIFLISFSKYQSDGRLKSLVKMASRYNRVDVVASGTKEDIKSIENITFLNDFQDNSPSEFFSQILKIFHSIFHADLILVDNRKAACLMLFLYIFVGRKKIIYDMREFYEISSSATYKKNLGTLFELFFIKKFVDVIICANEERRRLLKVVVRKGIGLIVIENIKKLELTCTSDTVRDEIGSEQFHRLSALSESNTVNIISTDGISYQRETHEVLSAYQEIKTNVHLHIFGRVSSDSTKVLQRIRQIENVTFYGAVSHEALSQILKYMDVGIVRYHNRDRNNRYCASGKLYEFIYSGLPVVCSSNLTLSKFINKTGTGVSDTSFKNGLTMLLADLELFKRNVQNYISTNKIENVENDAIEVLEKSWSRQR